MNLFAKVVRWLEQRGPRDGEYLLIRQLIALRVRDATLKLWHNWRRMANEENCPHAHVVYDPMRDIYWCSACPWTRTYREQVDELFDQSGPGRYPPRVYPYDEIIHCSRVSPREINYEQRVG